MVDTKDSKSFVSNGVRVQVSSPVYGLAFARPFFCQIMSARSGPVFQL